MMLTLCSMGGDCSVNQPEKFSRGAKVAQSHWKKKLDWLHPEKMNEFIPYKEGPF